MSLATGLIALAFFVAGLLYSPLKGKKLFWKKYYTGKAHIFIGAVFSVLCLSHILLSDIRLQFSYGIFAACFMLASILSGFIAYRVKKKHSIRRVHVIVSIGAALVILFHIFEKLL